MILSQKKFLFYLLLHLLLFESVWVYDHIKFFISGHIQVAQVPNRNEPDTSGEINYRYIFDLLQGECYDGYIGLEYKALNDTVKGLKWIEEFGLKLW